MSDLIERLREDEWGPYSTLRREAADALEAKDKEIERLREFLERGGIDSSAVLAGEDDGIWRDEIERLTGERDRQYDYNVEQVAKQAALEAEIERLREALDKVHQFVHWFENGPNKGMDICFDDPEFQEVIRALAEDSDGR